MFSETYFVSYSVRTEKCFLEGPERSAHPAPSSSAKFKKALLYVNSLIWFHCLHTDIFTFNINKVSRAINVLHSSTYVCLNEILLLIFG